ncbi:MAG: DnaA/Hda family protein [Moraxella sp.]|nr:DnaA/Hda family protein [Moraxella sp.]
MTSSQPSLNLAIRQDTSLYDFVSQGYTPIIAAINKLCDGDLSELFIYGGKGFGKTHLALAIYGTYSKRGDNAVILSLKEMVGRQSDDVNVLVGLETFDLIILDDIQSIAQNHEWQEALFHLINRVRKEKKQLIFLADKPARELDIHMLDLTTRLSLAPALKLPNGEDLADRIAIINSILRRKNWRLPEEILTHLIDEGPRNAGGIIAVLDSIASLLTHLTRVQVPKKTIEEAKSIIERKTLLLELEVDNYVYGNVIDTFKSQGYNNEIS